MSETPDLSYHAARVRFAECDAHGELQMASCVNLFSEAAALELRRVDVDLRALSAPGGGLREGAIVVQMHQPPGYDDELAIQVHLDEITATEFTLGLEMRRIGRPPLLAEGRVRYLMRASGTADSPALPPDLLACLTKLPQPALREGST